MNQRLEELPNASRSVGPCSPLTELTVLKGEYQQLQRAYQSIRQERDMLRKVLRAFRLSGVRRKFLSSTEYDRTDSLPSFKEHA